MIKLIRGANNVNREIGALIVKRYLWLAGWKLIKVLSSKTQVQIEKLKFNNKFLDVCKEFYLSLKNYLKHLG